MLSQIQISPGILVTGADEEMLMSSLEMSCRIRLSMANVLFYDRFVG